jgi:chromatin structure-remodeling complex subunit RSC1/2
MVSAARDMSTDASSRSVSNPFPGPVPAASQGYQQHLTPQYQPTTPAPLHQTPVPIPQPPHQNTSQVSTRPIHYQQPFHQSIPAHYAQTTPQVHPQAMNNSISSSYSQSIPPAAPRSSLGPVSGGPGLQGNIYNPPRPPEVYTLSDVVNDAIPAVFRERFQSDESGRVLFFTAPPQDRTQHGLSTESGGLGHSARFLAGRDQWLLSREKKRKERDEKAASDAEKRVSISVAAESTAGPVAAQAAYAVEKWFDTFDQDSEQWIKEAGLEGWREPVRG